MFVRDQFGNLIFVPRNTCFVEGEGEGAGSGSAGAAGAAASQGAAGGAAAAAGEGKGAEGVAAAGEGAAAATAAAAKGKEGAAEAEWRAGLSDDARKFAESSTDVQHVIDRALVLQKQVSRAIVPPGKDASEDDVAAYRKQIGVPDKADGYKFKMPEGAEPTDTDKAFHGTMAEAFHALNITGEQAKGLNKVWNDVTAAIQAEQVAADKRFAEESEAALRKSWGGDWDKNLAHAERAASQMFGDDFEAMRALEGKDGLFLMDHPVMLRALASLGREMAEGGLVPPMSADAAEQAEEQIKGLRTKQAEAQAAGDSKRANQLYAQEQQLLAKMKGSKPVVGSQGRAA